MPDQQEAVRSTGRWSRATEEIRGRAGGILSRSDGREGTRGPQERSRDDGDRRADRVADALARVADSLESMAESARASGMAVRDRGHDTAMAFRRGERILRKSGFAAATAQLAVAARRNARRIAWTGAGIVAAVVAARLMSGGDDPEAVVELEQG